MTTIRARLTILLAIFAIALPLLATPERPSVAQGPNLLTNGDMASGGYHGLPNDKGQAPNGWTVWANGEMPANDFHQFLPQVRSAPGAWVQRGGFLNWTAGGYQRVTGVNVGSTYRFTVYAFIWTCDDSEFSCTDSEGRTSDKSSNARVRVGIDPQGGTDPNSPNVLWSPFTQPWDAYAPVSVDVAAETEAMTVFTYSTSSVALFFRETLWDDASLVELGEGEGNPINSDAAGEGEGDTAPPPQTVPFVEPQSARPDGSVVHVVGEGDTFASIYVAYREFTTREALLELNGWELPPSIIAVGQEIEIMPPGSVDPETGRLLVPRRGTTGTGTPAATPVPTSTPASTPDGTPAATSPPPPTSPPAGDGGSGSTGGSVGPSTPVIDPDVEKGGSLLPGSSAPHTRHSGGSFSFMRPARPHMQRQQQAGLSTTGQVCVRFYDDTNADQLHNQNEAALSGGGFALGDQAYTIDDPAGRCVDDVPGGQVSLSITPPDGYGLLTSDQRALTVYPGQVTDVMLGLTAGAELVELPAASEDETLELDAVPVMVDTTPQDTSFGEQVLDNSAYLAFGLALAMALVSGGVLWVYRRT